MKKLTNKIMNQENNFKKKNLFRFSFFVLVVLVCFGVAQNVKAGYSLTPDASVDITDNIVTSSIVGPDGTIYIGGYFSMVGPFSGYGIPIDTTTGLKVANYPKVSATSGNTGVTSSVSDGNGGWYIGGSFTKVGDYTRNHLAHINADGSVDQNFDPNVNNVVNSLFLSGTTLYAGGSFTTVNGSTTRNRLAAFDTTTGIATSFDPNITGNNVGTLLLSGNTLYAGGNFTTVNGITTRNRLAAFDITTGIATSFDPNMGGTVGALLLSGTTLYAGGIFTTVNGSTTRNRLAAFDTTTGIATSFDPNIGNSVSSLVISGNTLYVGGNFTTVNGSTTRNRLAALDTTVSAGTATSFNPNIADGVSNGVSSMVLSGTTLYAGGDFTLVNGSTTRNRLAAFDTTTGTVTSFNPNISSIVWSISLSGTTLYAGGGFTMINPVTRNHLAAIDGVTGRVTSWNPNITFTTNKYITGLAISGNTLYVGGDFTTVNGSTTRNRLAAFDTATGTATSFNPNMNAVVYSLLLSGTTLYVGGDFTTVNGSTTRNRLAALDTTVAAGTATSFNPNMNSTVNSLLLSGTTLYAGGAFTTVNGSTTRNRLAALNTTVSAGTATSFDPNLNGSVLNNGPVSYTHLTLPTKRIV